MPIRPFRRLILPLALASALAFGVSACGGDDDGGGSSADATALLEEAFSNKIESATLSLDAEIQIDGVAELQGPIKLKLSGPFVDNGSGEIPNLDWDFSFSGAGQNLSAGATVTGDNAYVSFQGADYEVGSELYRQFADAYREQAGEGEQTLSQLGIEPEEWISDATVAGETENVAGAESTKVTGRVDVLQVIEDLGDASERVDGATTGSRQNPLKDLSDAERREIEDAVEDAKVEVYVANDDKTVRRLLLDVEFEVPADQREEAGGAEGGSAKLDFELADVGEKPEIEPPADSRPLADLLSQFGLGGELPAQ